MAWPWSINCSEMRVEIQLVYLGGKFLIRRCMSTMHSYFYFVLFNQIPREIKKSRVLTMFDYLVLFMLTCKEKEQKQMYLQSRKTEQFDKIFCIHMH